MYGLIVRMTAVPGQRDALIAILREGTPGVSVCLSYIIAKDSADENSIWITEVWDSMASHDASLSLPSVKNTIAKARPMISGVEKVAVTTPVGGHGLPSGQAH